LATINLNDCQLVAVGPQTYLEIENRDVIAATIKRIADIGYVREALGKESAHGITFVPATHPDIE
jgi:hypothetical protein